MKQVLHYIVFVSFFLGGSLQLSAQVDGRLFSLVYQGGGYNNGAINVYDPLISLDTIAMSLNGGTSGKQPYGNFMQDRNGRLIYGMTPYGGTYGVGFSGGTIIRYNIVTNVDSVVYSFNPHIDTLPYTCYGTLLYINDTSFYGLSYQGGDSNIGSLFSFNPVKYTVTNLVSLNKATVGYGPSGSPILVNDSMVYSLTTNNGTGFGSHYGTIFSYNIHTKKAALCHNFAGSPNDGNYPRGTLLLASNGLLYGLTVFGGTGDSGTLFSYNINTNIETILVNFSKSKGAYPYESLIQANDGNLYGTTRYGGAHDSGTLFSYNITSGTLTTMFSFTRSTGYQSQSDVIQANDGLLYGNTNYGGSSGYGTIFSYNIKTLTEQTLYNYATTYGRWPYGDFLEVMSVTDSVINNICPNGSSGQVSTYVRGGQAPLTYLWSTGATTSSISNLPSGIYYDTVWDSRGIEFSFIDTVKPLPMVLTFKVSNACSNTNTGSAAVNVAGGIGPFSYTWSNGETADTASNLASGTYTCTITDANGCPATNTVTITQATPIVITGIVATEQTYPGHNGTVTVYVTGGIPPGDTTCYLYAWSNGGPYDSSTISGLDSGAYSVCVTSCYGCGSTCSDSVKVLTGTKNLINSGNIAKVYPVPSTGLITLSLSGSGFDELEVTDALGRPVYKEPLSHQLSDTTLSIDLSGEPNGVYILYVHSQQGVLTRKIIIQK